MELLEFDSAVGRLDLDKVLGPSSLCSFCYESRRVRVREKVKVVHVEKGPLGNSIECTCNRSFSLGPKCLWFSLLLCARWRLLIGTRHWS
jgi:hypothetical protein